MSSFYSENDFKKASSKLVNNELTETEKSEDAFLEQATTSKV